MTANSSKWPEIKPLSTASDIQDDQSSWISLLNNQSVLEIKGLDAIKFLQGQCTADIEKLAINSSVPGAICTVKGRILSSFTITRIDDALLLKMPSVLVALTADYLKKYAAFFNVELCEWPTPCVVATHRLTTSVATTSAEYQLGNSEFREQFIRQEHLESFIDQLKQLDSDVLFLDETHWQDAQLIAGWVHLHAAESEKYLPHPLNLDQLGAISFTKGCYTGQEIIARTEYRGKPKKRLRLIELIDLPTDTTAPTDIAEVSSGKIIAELIRIASKKAEQDKVAALALMPVELEDSGSLLIDGHRVNYRNR